MRFIIMLAICITFGLANSFISLHDGAFLAKLINNKSFLEGKTSLAFYKSFYLTQHTVQDKEGFFAHPSGWLRLKFYIPAGTQARFVLSSKPNTSMRIDLKFKADNSNSFNHIEPQNAGIVLSAKENPLYSEEQPTIKNIAINTFNTIAYDMDEGGWVYVAIVENSAEIKGDNGYIEEAELIVNYELTIVDKEKFYNWLYNTTFVKEGGDPVDDVSELEEKDYTVDGKHAVPVRRILPLMNEGKYIVPEDAKLNNLQMKAPLDSNDEDTNIIEEQPIEQNIEENREVANNYQEIKEDILKELSEPEQEIVQSLLSGSFPIKGYFLQVQDEWIYVSNETKRVYKLEGIGENGSLKWTQISIVAPHIGSQKISFSLSGEKVAEESEQQTSQTNQTPGNESKSCPSGYSYDPELGYCTFGGEASEYQDTTFDGQQGPENEADGESTLPTPSSQPSSKPKSCPSGYNYDPELGYCTQ